MKKLTAGQLLKLLPVLFLALVFAFPAASFAGAKSGLLLWFNSILPSLLPCVILSNLLIRFGIAGYLAKYLAPAGRFLFGLSPYGCYPAFLGFFCGLPVGAKAAGDLAVQGKLSKKEAEYVITFCNNVSPMFLLSFVAADQLKLPGFGYPLCAIVWLSSILSGRLVTLPERRRQKRAGQIPEMPGMVAAMEKRSFIEEVDDAIMDSFSVLTKTGGYIILFSVLAQILLSFGREGPVILFFCGLLETTTGIQTISAQSLSRGVQIAACSAAAAFGGLSGLAQTKSVTKEAGLSLTRYTFAKLLSAAFAACAALLYVTLFHVI